MKLLDFILNNLENDSKFFNVNTVINIRNSINDNKPFDITDNEKKLLIDKFISKNNKFDRNTFYLFLSDENCNKLALDNDINSINYSKIKIYSKDEIILKALKEDFVLTHSSPDFLKRNFDVVKKSLLKRAKSIDYSDIRVFNNDQKKELISIVRNTDYILSKESNNIFKKDKIIVLNSIKRDIKSANYIDDYLLKDPDIFKYLYLHNYFYGKKNEASTLNYPLNSYNDENVIRKFLKYKKLISNDEAVEKYTKIIVDFLKLDIKISDFNELFNLISENAWENERNMNDKLYNNIFSKITSELRSSNSYEGSVRRFRFIEKMKDILKNKYVILEKAMRQYYDIYKSSDYDKDKKAKKSRDIISKLSALYIAKSKEAYKSRVIKCCIDDLFDVFIPNINNKEVKKIIMHNLKKKKFYELYDINDENINIKVNLLKNSYLKDYNREIIDKMFDEFILNETNEIDNLIAKPDYYLEYLKYKKALKLINRLNRGYIKYDGIEISKYKDVIGIDINSNKYTYIGIMFSDEEIRKFIDYEKIVNTYNSIKKHISKLIDSEIKIDGIDKSVLLEYQYDFKFNDEYYVFDKKSFLNNIKFIDFIKFDFIESDIDDNSYDSIYNYLISKRMLFIYILMGYTKDGFITNEINKEDILSVINNFSDIEKLSNTFDCDLNNLKTIFVLNKLSHLSSLETISVLGKELIYKFSTKYNYNNRHLKNILDIAKELVVRMSLVQDTTIPNIEGSTEYYKYLLYNQQDESLLTSGTDTDSCFRINGTDNDFLHYCALDKNGIVIKITDKHDNFIGRAAGFRNGNCIFLNQLRTIYDKKDNKLVNIHEKNDIIKAFYKACSELVIESSKNDDEEIKIDFVFINASYILRDEQDLVNGIIATKIQDNLIDLKSKDFSNFILNTKNIDCNNDEYFETDYGSYGVICVAKSNKELKDENLYLKDIDSHYKKKRSKMIVTSNKDKKLYSKLNKIAGTYSYLNSEPFKPIKITLKSTVIMGDNWYIIYDDNNIIDYRLIKEDHNAYLEFVKAVKAIYGDAIKAFTVDNIDNKLKILSKRLV